MAINSSMLLHHCREMSELKGATRGVMVSMSGFLAYHQCYCAGSSLVLGLNLGL